MILRRGIPIEALKRESLKTPPQNLLEFPLSQILQFKHQGVILKLKTKHRHSSWNASRLFQDLLRFLILCAENPSKRIVPTKTLDTAWHEFILYTQDYSNFCARYLGKFVHHYPSGKMDRRIRKQLDDDLLTTHTLAEFRFVNLSKNWDLPIRSRRKKNVSDRGSCASGECRSCSSCTSCEG